MSDAQSSKIPPSQPYPGSRRENKPTGPRKFHFSLPLTLVSLVILGILLVLGDWQTNRYEESMEIISTYRYQHNELPPLTTLAVDVGDVPREEALRYRRMEIKGKFVVSELQLLTSRYKFAKPGLGLLLPLRVNEGPHKKILVYLGWVPREKLEEFIKTLDPNKEVTVKGRLNLGDKNPTSKEPVGEFVGYPTWRNTNLDTLKNYIDDMEPQLLLRSGEEAIGQHISLDDLPLDGYEVPIRTAPSKHVEYALTWFGLALSLVIVFFAYSFRRTHLPEDNKPPQV